VCTIRTQMALLQHWQRDICASCVSSCVVTYVPVVSSVATLATWYMCQLCRQLCRDICASCVVSCNCGNVIYICELCRQLCRDIHSVVVGITATLAMWKGCTSRHSWRWSTTGIYFLCFNIHTNDLYICVYQDTPGITATLAMWCMCISVFYDTTGDDVLCAYISCILM